MTRKPKMIDVARAAGVSAMTVSRALKGESVVTEATRKRILAAVDELGYVLDLSAAHLSSKRSGFISVLVPTGSNSNFNETVQGISEVLEPHNKQILIGYTNYSLKREERIIETMLQRRPEGIIIAGSTHTERTRKLLEKSATPVIEIWDLPKKPVSHVVGFSNAAPIDAMVEHLASKGYKNIAFVGGEDTEDIRGNDRRKGYENGMQRLGLKQSQYVPDATPPVSIKQGSEALAPLLESWPDVDAIICVSDLVAYGIIMECHRRKISVPEQIAVCGFGDFELASQCWPAITTIGVNSRLIGTEAGKLMLNAIEKHDSGLKHPQQKIETPYKIIERETT